MSASSIFNHVELNGGSADWIGEVKIRGPAGSDYATDGVVCGASWPRVGHHCL